MKMVYRVLAYLIALGVALQAAAIALGFFGLASWVEGGGVLDKAFIESGTSHFTADGAFEFHGTVGVMVIPILGLLLLISSFFVKVQGAIKWALIVFGSIVLQVVLGLFAHSIYWLGALHGLFAFAVLAFATVAASRIARAPIAAPQATADEPSPVDVG